MNETYPLFSIIVPVYNTEKYLRRCIDSLVNQTFKNFEIIIIDDCSNGNCNQIIDSFNDNRIAYIKHDYNKGTLISRKTGSIIAKGKYITYLDSDDELNLNALNTVYNNIIDKDYDVIHCSVKSISLNPNKKERIKEEKKTSWYLSSKRNNIDNKYLFNELLNEKIPCNVCAKFFKSEIVKKSIKYIPNIHLTFAEDMLQCLIFFYFVKSYKAIYEELYIYHNDVGYSNKDIDSLSTDRFNKMCMESKRALDEFYKFLVNINSNVLYMYEYMKLSYNQYRFLSSKICHNSEYEIILGAYFTNDFLKQYEIYDHIHGYYLKPEARLKEINKKLLPYFFSVILDDFYAYIRIFGISINIKTNRLYERPIVITFSNILRILFSIRFNKDDIAVRLLGLKLCFRKI